MNNPRIRKLNRSGIPASALCLLALIFAACSGALDDAADITDSPRARLPINGDWRFIKRDPPDIPAVDAGKSIFLDIDGAMSYSCVWLNGQLVGGWPFGYASYRLDLADKMGFLIMDAAELFLNGRSLGRKKKAQFEYRLRWDDVIRTG